MELGLELLSMRLDEVLASMGLLECAKRRIQTQNERLECWIHAYAHAEKTFSTMLRH